MWRRTLPILAGLLLGGPAAAQTWQSHGQQWPEVPCTQAHISVPGEQLCRQGPIAGVDAAYTYRQCAFEQWYAYARPPAERGAVNVFMRQAGSDAACWVNPFGDPNAALNAFAIVRNAGNRSALAEAGGLSSIAFTSAAGESCAAFVRYGARWQGGYTYSLRGFFCAPKGSPLAPAALHGFVGAIVVNTQ